MGVLFGRVYNIDVDGMYVDDYDYDDDYDGVQDWFRKDGTNKMVYFPGLDEQSTPEGYTWFAKRFSGTDSEGRDVWADEYGNILYDNPHWENLPAVTVGSSYNPSNDGDDFSANSGGVPGWMGDANTGIGAFGLANGAKTEIFDYAIRSNYKSARTYGEFNKLRPTQQAWRTTNTLGKTGASYLNGAKLLGKGVFGVTVINSSLNAGSAFYNDDPNKWGVAGKAGLDVTMGYIGFLGPIGFGISATYFILDASGAFNSWSQPTNR